MTLASMDAGRLADDLVALQGPSGDGGHVRQIEVGVPGGGNRQLELGQQALGIAHTAQARRQLDEDAAAPGVNALGQVAQPMKLVRVPSIRGK